MLHKKSLGQHFLRNQNILQKIAGAAELTRNDTVLEVGPGEGALTEFLLARAGKVVAVEKDEQLIPVLQKRFASEIALGKLELVYGDILTSKLPKFSTYKIVANIPYYITGQFLRKFLQSETQPTMMVLLLQKEVAKRIISSDKRESILSISVKCYGTPQYIAMVKAGSFSPPPKVDSAILKIADISKGFFNIPSPSGTPFKGGIPISPLEGSTPTQVGGRDVLNEEKFFTLLKKGFAHPRKLLSSNLDLPASVLLGCGIAEKARAENVTLEQWKQLALR